MKQAVSCVRCQDFTSFTVSHKHRKCILCVCVRLWKSWVVFFPRGDLPGEMHVPTALSVCGCRAVPPAGLKDTAESHAAVLSRRDIISPFEQGASAEHWDKV